MERKSIIPSTSGSKRKSRVSNQDEVSDQDDKLVGSGLQVKIPKSKIVKMETASDGKLPGDGEEVSLEEFLFSNDLLLREIFKYLNFKDLKTCRSVQRLWNLEATKLLLKHIPMESINVSRSKVQLEGITKYFIRPTKLSNFRNFVENSQIFPCNTFAITNVYLKEKMNNFFGPLGHLVKYLHLKDDEYYIYVGDNENLGKKDVLTLLSENLPNLETLELTCTHFIPDAEAKTLFGTVHFRKLHTLELIQEVSPSLVATIMKITPSLKNIFLNFGRYFCNNLEDLIEIKAIPLLKNIRFHFHKKICSLFERVLEQEPKIERIETIDFREETFSPLDLARFGRILTTMFHQSSESLKEIYMLLPLGHLPSLKIPVLPNVTILCMEYVESDHQTPSVVVPFFPPEVNFEQTFPNLKELELCFGEFEDLRSKEIFPESSTPLVSLRYFKVFSTYCEDRIPIPEIWMKQFCKLVPNITKADFDVMSFPALELVWGFPVLQDLKLTIAAGENLIMFPEWDSAFTGFSHETVHRFYRKRCAALQRFGESEVKDLRVKPSVLDLKNLKKLCIEVLYDGMDFDDSDNRDLVTAFERGVTQPVLMVKDHLILSHLTKRFGFDMCPELKSNVSIQLTKYDTITMPESS